MYYNRVQLKDKKNVNPRPIGCQNKERRKKNSGGGGGVAGSQPMSTAVHIT